MSTNKENNTSIALTFGIDAEELEKLAAVGYSPESLAMYFKVQKSEFMHHFNSPGSVLRYHYNRGILENQGKEAMAMLDKAKKGNTTQGQRLDKLRYEIDFEQQKNKIIYGEDEDDI